MTFSAARELPLIALLALGLLLKVATNGADTAQNPQLVGTRVAEMLTANGLESQHAVYPIGPEILANKGACRMVVWEYSPHGTTANVLEELARPYGSLRYAFRGKLYSRPPKVEPLIDFFSWREMKRLGIDAARSPVLAIAASPGCNVDRFNWGQVAKLKG